MPILTPDQVAMIQERYRDLVNYAADDPVMPVDPLTYRGSDGDSLLHIAAARGDSDTVALLLHAGLDPNMQGDMGYTPLHWSAENQHWETVDILIALGARLDAINEFGNRPNMSVR